MCRLNFIYRCMIFFLIIHLNVQSASPEKFSTKDFKALYFPLKALNDKLLAENAAKDGAWTPDVEDHQRQRTELLQSHLPKGSNLSPFQFRRLSQIHPSLLPVLFETIHEESIEAIVESVHRWRHGKDPASVLKFEAHLQAIAEAISQSTDLSSSKKLELITKLHDVCSTCNHCGLSQSEGKIQAALTRVLQQRS